MFYVYVFISGLIWVSWPYSFIGYHLKRPIRLHVSFNVKISSIDDHCKCSLCRADGAEVLFCVRSLGSFTTRAMKVPRILYGLVINGMSSSDAPRAAKLWARLDTAVSEIGLFAPQPLIACRGTLSSSRRLILGEIDALCTCPGGP